MDARSLLCTVYNSRSQWSEERLLLHDLLAAAEGRPGVFIELGALDGLSGSNTLALERCFNWTGCDLPSCVTLAQSTPCAIEPREHNILRICRGPRVLYC
eukprot:1051985-Prymnesium_polylepis.1